jgi:hypothetical protein
MMRLSLRLLTYVLLLGLVLFVANRVAAQPKELPPGAQTYPFEVREQPWRKVFEWLANKTQLPFMDPDVHTPPGALTFLPPVSPNGKPKEYTLPQIIDIINESLRVQNMMVLRRDAAIVLIDTTEKLDGRLVPRITPAELANHGRTEPVSVVLPLRTLKAQEIAAEARQLLGESGAIEVLPRVNALLLCDTGGNVERAIAILKLLETPSAPDTKIASSVPVEHPAIVPPNTKIAFEMRAVPWKYVLEWLSDRTWLPVVASEIPEGTFSFIGPKDAKEPVTYTVAEIVDLINDALAPKHWRLVRRPGSFQLVRADGRLDPAFVPHIDVAELKSRGRSEVASITLPIQTVGDPKGVRDVRKLMGSFGSVVVLPGAKRVLLEDTVENLRRICSILGMIEPPADVGSPPRLLPPAQKLPDVPKKGGDHPTDDQLLGQIRLMVIMKAEKGPEAFLNYPGRSWLIRLRPPPGPFERFRILNADFEVILECQMLRIDSRDVYLATGDRAYRLHVGDSLADAMKRPLPPDVAKQLHLSIGK